MVFPLFPCLINFIAKNPLSFTAMAGSQILRDLFRCDIAAASRKRFPDLRSYPADRDGLVNLR